MVCSKCGERAQGKYCSECETINAVEKLAGDDADERAGDEEPKEWKCTQCGERYEDDGWSGCPECGSKRRRAPQEVTA